ncbi:MAG: hypothetical protein Q9160_001562 [Pyrenula sp. 1 TL-2023]
MSRRKIPSGGRGVFAKPPSNNLSLPTQLQKELGLSTSSTGQSAGSALRHKSYGERNKFATGLNNRKEKRRAEREERKSTKRKNPRASIVSEQVQNGAGNKKLEYVNLAEAQDVPLRKTLKSILKKPKSTSPEPLPKIRRSVKDVSNSESESSTSSEIGFNGSRSASPELRLDATSRAYKDRSMQDDAEILALEKKLGRSGKKTKTNDEADLDNLLGGLDEDRNDAMVRKRKREESEWLASKRRRSERPQQKNGTMSAIESPSADDFDDLDEGSIDVSLSGEESDFESIAEDDPIPRQRENPYVPPIPATSSQKYVPPSLRQVGQSDTEDLTRLKRQIQGLLNKLSESNMISILQEVEKLYSSNPRQSVTTSLIDLLLSLICDRSALQNTFIILHAGFAAGVYKIIGTDFGAELIASLVTRFDNLYDAALQETTSSKETSNAISFLCHLYTFHVTSSILIFDYIRLFLTSISELNTELLLRAVRDSGPQLRQDDPSSLKDIVLTLQRLAAQASSAGHETSVRTKFMIETITDLKNNKLKAGAFASTLASEHITRMRKTLSSLNARRSLRATEPLRISLSDIRNREKRGQWWLVGASWNNNPSSPSSATNAPDPSTLATSTPQSSPALLASSHRMNTPTRRAIFIALITSTDYMDAISRIRALRLKRHALDMEVPRVLLRCTSSAEAGGLYNPYYTLVARELCCREGGKRGRMGLQFALWGWLRVWGEGDGQEEEDDDMGGEGEEDGGSLQQTVCLARMFAQLIAEQALSISILKTVDFMRMRGEKARAFCEVLLICVLQHLTRSKRKAKSRKGRGPEIEDAVEVVFARAATEAPQMVQGLRWFLRKVVGRTDLLDREGEKEKRRVREGCECAVRVLERGVHAARAFRGES